MMDRYQIRLGETDSVNSVNNENFLDVQLKSTSKKLHYNDIKATIDQYELFEKERSECTRYRIILTINPYCTNVLFNPLTEIYKKEDNGTIERYFLNQKTVNGIEGQQTPKRIQMIANTEYSKESPRSTNDKNYGYTYMPGYDIFDNHIFRNNGLKTVEIENTSAGNDNVFNTLCDYDRDSDGKILEFMKRRNLSEKPKKEYKHLYGYDDILSYEDSVNANLTDENGWFGFINSSNLITSSVKSIERSDICRVINNRKNCEFIDMYPDRTLFSFSPKYNKEQGRLENNWDVFITYAYDKEFCDDLVSFKSLNSLPVMYVSKEIGLSGNEIYVFRCYTKHNLKRNDTVKVYDCDKNGDEDEPVGIYRVGDIGGVLNVDPEYYFYIDGFDADGIDTGSSNIRIRKTYNGMDSEYYIRKLKKIKKIDGEVEKELSVERYKLAFASTIYDDDTTQFTFTDDIDISELRDNLNRPLTELFVTIVKKNVGHEKWYGINGNGSEDTVSDKDIEISHCFDDVMVGFSLSHESSDRNADILKKREAMRDVRTINKWNFFGSSKYPITVTPDGTSRFVKSEGGEVITEVDEDVFYGDVVEYSSDDCLEHVLSECSYRFNTYQRENSLDRGLHAMVKDFIYHEIKFDDNDLPSKGTEKNFISQESVNNVVRREGYYYKANYSIPIRSVGDVRQMGNKDIRVNNVKPVYKGSIVLRVTASLPSRLNINDIVYVCDDKNKKMFEFVCTEVKSPTVFSIEPNVSECEDKWTCFSDKWKNVYGGEKGIDWLQLSNLLINQGLRLRGKNYDIPDYAFRAGNNAYIWRDVLYDAKDSSVPDYTFTNGAFYLTPIIRFYLKRQDPNNSIGLYVKDSFPNDVYGNIEKKSNYYYEEDLEDRC